VNPAAQISLKSVAEDEGVHYLIVLQPPLPGVLGAFCIKEDGSLIESFLPAPYTDAVFEEFGPRIANLLAAANMSYSETNEMLLRFSTNALYLKRGDGFVVGLFTVGNPLVAGLRVSTNLLLKQARSDIASAAVKDLPQPAAPSHSKEPASGGRFEDDIIVNPKKAEVEEAPEKKKRGLFGLKKNRKPKPKNKTDSYDHNRLISSIPRLHDFQPGLYGHGGWCRLFSC
jgi:predicted regulator of Ras-like GTPase activity (Roadblock/LC7/MglB family)